MKRRGRQSAQLAPCFSVAWEENVMGLQQRQGGPVEVEVLGLPLSEGGPV